MIFAYKNDRGLGIIPLDFLVSTGVLYIVSGALYIYLMGRDIPVEVYFAMAALATAVAVIPRGVVWLDCQFSALTERNLLALSFFGIFCYLVFLVIGGWGYLAAEKIERSAHISRFFFLRIPLYVAFVIGTLLQMSMIHLRARYTLLWLLSLVALVEMNREFIVILSITWAAFLWREYRIKLIPPGLLGGCLLVLGLMFILFLAKPMMYFLVLGEVYDGGLMNFGETVNWARWLLYAEDNNVDITDVQKNDLLYGVYALFLPYSPVTSSSAEWFSNVLMEADLGRTFGYSGLLWLSRWFPGFFIYFPLVALFYLYGRISGGGVVRAILAIALAMVSFRFWRSEWVLVEKTLLWTYFYPAILCWLVARLRFK